MTLPDQTIIDGYDRARLANCLAQRGLLMADQEITAVSASGMCVELSSGQAIWVLPRWIESARVRPVREAG